MLFYNLRHCCQPLNAAIEATIEKTFASWANANIPTREKQNCIKKLKNVYEKLRKIQKNANRRSAVQKQREEEFKNILDDLFDIAHADAEKIMKIDFKL